MSKPIILDATEVNPGERFDDRVAIDTSRLFGALPEGWEVVSREIRGRDTEDARRIFWHMFTHESVPDVQIRFTPQGAWVFDDAPADADTRWAVQLEHCVGDEPFPTSVPEHGFYDFEAAVTYVRSLMHRIQDGRVDPSPVVG